MKEGRVRAPLLILFAGLTVALGVAGQWPFAALAAVGLVATLAIGAMKRAPEAGGLSRDDLHPSDWARLAPIRRHRNAIEELVNAKSSDPAVAVIAAEALAEADQILAQAIRMLGLRRELLRTTDGRGNAERDLAQLDQQLAQAASDAEKSFLASAMEARRRELDHYRSAEEAKERVELGLRQAETALAELKARLAAAAANPAGTGHEDELRQSIGRLKSLETSLEEAEAWLKG